MKKALQSIYISMTTKKAFFMKKICFFLVCTVLFSLLSCDNQQHDNKPDDTSVSETSSITPPKPQILLPPSRVGHGTVYPTVVSKYKTLEGMFSVCDAIAVVRIGNWLKENDSFSYFEASVLTCLYGKLPDNIVVYQLGTSKNTIPGTVIASYGDELLMFLCSNEGKGAFENSYFPAGVYFGSFDAILLGTEYVFVDRYSIILNSNLHLTNLFVNDEYKQHIHSELKARYGTYASQMQSYSAAYSVNELMSELLKSES